MLRGRERRSSEAVEKSLLGANRRGEPCVRPLVGRPVFMPNLLGEHKEVVSEHRIMCKTMSF